MKLVILALVLCLVGCSATPDMLSEEQSNSSGPNNVGNVSNNQAGDRGGCQPFRVITVWENGEPKPQVQPVLCNQGPNIFKGDPGPDRGDPNPWDFSPQQQNSDPVIKNNKVSME